LLQLVVTLAAVVLACLVTHTTAVLIVVVALVVMVMLHELGHLLTAKWSHMKVTEYFLGFGPRLWSIRRGETEYGVKAIPAGGYVKILGMTSAEEVDPADEPRAYRQQPFHNRLMVAVAGSAMHGVMALALLWGLFVFVGGPQANEVGISGFSALSGHVDPAKAAGLRAGDVVVRAGGVAISSAQQLECAIWTHPARPLALEVRRAGQLVPVTVTPAAEKPTAQAPAPSCPATAAPSRAGAAPVTGGRIGVVIGEPTERSGPVEGVVQAWTGLGRVITATFSGFGQVFSTHGIASYFHQLGASTSSHGAQSSAPRIQSIYGAARTAVQGAEAGAGQLLTVLVLIIVGLGIVNLVPMLPLDGGHVLIAVYERIRSRRGRPYHADVTKLLPVVYAFVLILGFLVLSSLYLDITHPVKNPFQ